MIKTLHFSMACVAALAFTAGPSFADTRPPVPTPLADSKAKQSTTDINITGMT